MTSLYTFPGVKGSSACKVGTQTQEIFPQARRESSDRRSAQIFPTNGKQRCWLCTLLDADSGCAVALAFSVTHAHRACLLIAVTPKQIKHSIGLIKDRRGTLCTGTLLSSAEAEPETMDAAAFICAVNVKSRNAEANTAMANCQDNVKLQARFTSGSLANNDTGI